MYSVYTEVRFMNCEETREQGKEGSRPERNNQNIKRQYSKRNWKRYHTGDRFSNKNTDRFHPNSPGVPESLSISLL